MGDMVTCTYENRNKRALSDPTRGDPIPSNWERRSRRRSWAMHIVTEGGELPTARVNSPSFLFLFPQYFPLSQQHN